MIRPGTSSFINYTTYESSSASKVYVENSACNDTISKILKNNAMLYDANKNILKREITAYSKE